MTVPPLVALLDERAGSIVMVVGALSSRILEVLLSLNEAFDLFQQHEVLLGELLVETLQLRSLAG